MSTSKQQKQVRFAYRNIFHSPVTPALTFASSIPSTEEPITPPQTAHGLPGPSPYTIFYVPQFPANPPHYAQPLRPHPLLESAMVNWDLIENPTSTITVNNYLLSSRLLVEHATTPPLPALSISMHLPWIINVYASNGPYVTLEDLFDSVYHSLRTNITSDEFNLLLNEDDQKTATCAYKQRCMRFRKISACDEEKRGGMKRVDFLMGRTMFHSISNTGRRSDEWQLYVSWHSLPWLERQI